MDILVSVFLFAIGFVFTLIGVPRGGNATVQNSFMLAIGGMILVVFGVFVVADPIETISGFSSLENESITNLTTTTTTVNFTPITTSLNTLIALMVIGIGLFLMIFAGLIFPRE